MGQKQQQPFAQKGSVLHVLRSPVVRAWLLLVLLLCPLPPGVLVKINSATGYSIPGTTQTLTGYDTELGEDALCWKSHGSQGGADDRIAFDNPLLANFRLDDRVELLLSCPQGNALTATAPEECQRGMIMRTRQWYNYSVAVSLDLRHLNKSAPTLVSDKGPGIVAVQILVCELGITGFCSPFIHEEASARLRAMNMTRETARGERHGGTHVHSAFQYVELAPDEGPVYDFTLQVPMMVNEPGNFFVIAAVQLYLGSVGDNETRTRYDMANALIGKQRLIKYQAPAEILEVTDSVLNVSYIAIGVAGAIISFLLCQTVWHRNHQVLKLTQGNFLILFLGAALTATLATVLLEPRNDLFCLLSRPIIMCSAQLLYAVTLGRLWRINAVISPLLVQTLREQAGLTRQIVEVLRRISLIRHKDSNHNKSKNLRRQINSRQLAVLIAAFTAPQLLIQMLGMILQPPYRDVDFNSDESKGRAYCNSGSPLKSSILFYGYICFALLIVTLLITAHYTRALPSLLNETSDIFSSTLATLVIFVLGFGIVTVAESPTTSPAVQYLVAVSLTLSITLNTSVRIMVPKLRMIWNGETVLVSKLVSDHKETVKRDDERFNNRRKLSSGSTFSDVSSSCLPTTSMGPSRSSRFGQAPSSIMDDDGEVMDRPCPDASLTKVTSNGYTDRIESRQNFYDDISAELELKSSGPGPARRPRRQVNAKPHGRISSRIVVTQDETPSRRLVLKMIDLQNNLARVNLRIMSGTAVSEDEWETLRRMSTKLGSTFKNEVEFSWQRGTEKARAWNYRPSESSEPYIEDGHRESDASECDDEEALNTQILEESDDEDFEAAADVEEANWGDRLVI